MTARCDNCGSFKSGECSNCGYREYAQKEWLLEKKQENKTMKEMGEEAGVNEHTIKRHLRRHDINLSNSDSNWATRRENILKKFGHENCI